MAREETQANNQEDRNSEYLMALIRTICAIVSTVFQAVVLYKIYLHLGK
jgi:Ni,Fe-hydrogenase I cytochrome b subunit